MEAKLNHYGSGNETLLTEVELRLSRRNIESLLAKLDGHPPGSARTLERGPIDRILFRVIAEENDVHYASRGGQAGLMHPETEVHLGGD